MHVTGFNLEYFYKVTLAGKKNYPLKPYFLQQVFKKEISSNNLG